MKAIYPLVALALISTAGCRCGGGNMTNKPDFVAMPTAMSFSACPTKDEGGAVVADVFPDEQKVNIQNLGKAGGALTVTLDGTNKDQFKLDAARTPTSIGPSETVEVPVQFTPVKKGDARGQLTIDDGDPDTMPVTVDLVGTGKNLPSQPTIDASIEDYTQPGHFTACVPGVICQQGYPDTLLKDAATLRIKLKNTGCPALKITNIDLAKSSAGSDNMAFFLEQPSVLPSTSSPLVMSTADGTSEITLVIRFAPEPDNSGDTQRFADLIITSNDPNNPMFSLSLSGQGVKPEIYANPSFCDFNNPDISCRPTGTKVLNKAVFEITNGGSSMVKIDSALFKSTNMNNTGSGGRFTVMTPIDGQVLTPGQKATLNVDHLDQPLYVVDQITVSASIPGQAAGGAGKVFITIAGGTAPCIETDPEDTLDFTNPTMETTSKLITIKALAMKGTTPCGDLIVDSTEIATNPFFSVVDPVTAGTRITAGMQKQFSVQYKKPVTGNRQAANLVIQTNDLAIGAPKTLLVQSESPLNQIPICDIKGCLPAMTDCHTMGVGMSMVVSLSAFGGGAKAITLWGGDSYDPGNPVMPGIGLWKFQVLAPNPNVTGYTLTGMSQFQNMNSQTLTLDPVATGQYRVYLTVKDDTGQQSGAACELKINVYQ